MRQCTTPSQGIVVNGRGLHQFAYQVDGDRYLGHYVPKAEECLNQDYHCCTLPGKWVKLRFAGKALTITGLVGPDQGSPLRLFQAGGANLDDGGRPEAGVDLKPVPVDSEVPQVDLPPCASQPSS